MTENQPGPASGTVGSVVEKFKNLPAAQDAGAQPREMVDRLGNTDRLFGREKSVHDLLGAGRFADVLLWRTPLVSFGLLAVVTAVYIVFEWVGCHVLSVMSKGALIALAAVFVWSNIANLVKRSPVDVPAPHLSEERALQLAQALRDEVNIMLNMLHDVVLGKDVLLFLEVEVALWALAYVGKWADFLTTVYVGMFILLTVPALYERHEEKVDHTIRKGYRQTQQWHGRLQDQIANKMPQLAHGPQKKMA